MSEKKYDVYSGNQKIGEVWGKSDREIQSEERVREHSKARDLLRFTDELDSSPEAAYRNRLRKTEKESGRQKKIWGWLCVAGVVLSIYNLSWLEMFFLGSVTDVLMALLHLFIGKYTYINAVLVVAYIVLGKIKFDSKKIFQLKKLVITGKTVRKVIAVLALYFLYKQFGPGLWTAGVFVGFLRAAGNEKRARDVLHAAEDKAIFFGD